MIRLATQRGTPLGYGPPYCHSGKVEPPTLYDTIVRRQDRPFHPLTPLRRTLNLSLCLTNLRTKLVNDGYTKTGSGGSERFAVEVVDIDLTVLDEGPKQTFLCLGLYFIHELVTVELGDSMALWVVQTITNRIPDPTESTSMFVKRALRT